MYALIMAGGSGTRFWPKSRHNLPKQLIKISDREDDTLIQLTFKRIKKLIPPQNIFIVTNILHRDEILRQLPEMNKDNLISEPIGRNTAPCIGLGALHIKHKNSKGVMIVLSADHYIKDESSFIDTIKNAAQFAKGSSHLVTIGIEPKYPETGYGYIKQGALIEKLNQTAIYKVDQFREKPDRKTAVKLLETGKYYWNCGTFIGRVDVILENISKHLPELYSDLKEIDANIKKENTDSLIEKVYYNTTAISIDYGVLEKSDNVVMIPCSPGWSDVGCWNSLYNLHEKDTDVNVFIVKAVTLNTKNSLLDSGKKFIATVGVDNLIIIETKDAILVCNKDNSQDVKKITEILKENEMEEYL